MNRREFIVGSAAAAFAPQFAFGAESKKITRRPLGKGGLTVPLLGFGMMRIPKGREAQAMVDRAMEVGLDYFDTAYGYQGGASERFIGGAFAKYPRDSWTLVDKLPAGDLNDEADMERVFNEQLQRTKAGRFDVYFLHFVTEKRWPKMQSIKALEFIQRKQEAGLVKRIGFSYHGGTEGLRPIAQAAKWDLVQLQMSLWDYDKGAKDRYDVLTELGIPVAIMSPLSGGRYAKMPKEAEEILKKAAPERSLASWSFRLIGSLPNVSVILSGMNKMEHLEDNIKTFTDFQPLSSSERAALDEARQKL